MTMDFIKPTDITFSLGDSGQLDCALASGDTHEDVHCVALFPLSNPDHYITVVVKKDKEPGEIGILLDLGELGRDQRALVRNAVAQRYFLPEITEIVHVMSKDGLYEWDVVTDRGPKQFDSASSSKSDSVSVTEQGIIIVTDLEKCRYKISDPDALSALSRRYLDKVLL